MTLTITDIQVRDIRFPTSDNLDGSDAMNPDPDYSCAYLTLITDGTQVGHGLSFTLGRGTELIAVAVDSLRRLVVGKTLEEITSDMGGFWREVTGDSQLRWMGPDKGVMHFAVGVIVNAVWDLWAKVAEKPLWLLLADMTPAETVKCIDFRYINDALTPQDALEILEQSCRRETSVFSSCGKQGFRHTQHQRGGWAIATKSCADCVAKVYNVDGRTLKSRWDGISKTTCTERN
jgi:L-fuconate dehydratase